MCTYMLSLQRYFRPNAEARLLSSRWRVKLLLILFYDFHRIKKELNFTKGIVLFKIYSEKRGVFVLEFWGLRVIGSLGLRFQVTHVYLPE